MPRGLAQVSSPPHRSAFIFQYFEEVVKHHRHVTSHSGSLLAFAGQKHSCHHDIPEVYIHIGLLRVEVVSKLHGDDGSRHWQSETLAGVEYNVCGQVSQNSLLLGSDSVLSRRSLVLNREEVFMTTPVRIRERAKDKLLLKSLRSNIEFSLYLAEVVFQIGFIHPIHYKQRMSYRRLMTENNEILAKTELALQAIKQRDLRMDSKSSYNPINMLGKLDRDYCEIISHKEVKAQQLMRLQIFSYTNEYYFIDMRQFVFPMRLIIKNVKNTGTVCIGYDRQFPGLQKNPDHNVQSNEKTFDYKADIDREVMITLKNKQNRNIQKVYFNFSANKELFLLNFKVDFLGFSQISIPPNLNSLPRSNTLRQLRQKTQIQTKNFKQRAVSLKIVNPKNLKNTQILNCSAKGSNFFGAKESFSPTLKELSKEVKQIRRPSQFRLQPILQIPQKSIQGNYNQPKKEAMNRGIRNTYFIDPNYSPEVTQKNFMKANAMMIKTLSINKQPSPNKQASLRQEAVKLNKQILDLCQQKEWELKNTAVKCRSLIEAYQKQYREGVIKRRKLNKTLAPLIYAIKFLKNSFYYNQKAQKRIGMAFRVNYAVFKFCRILQKKAAANIKMLPWHRYRVHAGTQAILRLMGKTLNHQGKRKAGGILWETLQVLKPALILNHALNSAQKYRAKVRTIQRCFIIQHRSRQQMLRMYSKIQVGQILKEHPHLKLFMDQFEAKNIAKHICRDYVADESLKYRYIFQAYKGVLEEIDSYVQQNKLIEQYNKKAEKNNLEPKRQKIPLREYLQVPTRPDNPQYRFFRNVDILKSMLRSWFEIEYKKWLKKNNGQRSPAKAGS